MISWLTRRWELISIILTTIDANGILKEFVEGDQLDTALDQSLNPENIDHALIDYRYASNNHVVSLPKLRVSCKEAIDHRATKSKH